MQLVGTAHGNTLDNLLVNPTLSDLVGGIQAVTLGDEEARRRGTQKTVLERKAPPTFDVLVEQEERHLVGIHKDVAASVDDLLRGESPQREMRERLQDGSLRHWTERAPRAAAADGVGLPVREAPLGRDEGGMRRGGGRSALGGQSPRSPWWEDRRENSDFRRERGAARGQTLAEMTWLDPNWRAVRRCWPIAMS